MRLDPTEGVIVFTDGSSNSNVRTGGWAWVALDAYDGTHEGSGSHADTTNNQMELLAATMALLTLHAEYGECAVIIRSDSMYVVGGMTLGWSKAKNAGFWSDLDEAVSLHDIVLFEHVKGHNGNRWNERADKLAGQARKKSSAAKPRKGSKSASH